MKRILGVISVVAIFIASCGKETKTMAEGFEALKTQADSVSYYIGNDVGQNFKMNNIHRVIVPSAFNKGLKDGFNDAELLVEKSVGNDIIMGAISEIRGDTSSFTFQGSSIEGFTALSTRNDSISYFLGSDIAAGMKGNRFNHHFSEACFFKGLEDGFTDATPLLTKEQGQAVGMAIIEKERENIMADEKAKYDEQIAKDEEYLKNKSAEEGVVTLPSGLRYKVIEEGTGKKPALTDAVSTNYIGYFTDGTVFQDSKEVNQDKPVKFMVNGVIPGWTEALQLMPQGSKWELYIPYNLAYGESGNQGIPPYSALRFEIELLEVLSEEEKQEMIKEQEDRMRQMQMQQQMQQQIQQQMQQGGN